MVLDCIDGLPRRWDTHDAIVALSDRIGDVVVWRLK